ncbi:MAG: radical SAM protein [Acidobacteriia bacterium]|nr:radical SAM protein [Terriglobia bacterium]
MRVLLISTYELGRQPFGLASPAACLRAAGHRVDCLDCSLDPLTPEMIRNAGLIAFYLPMHTATRMAVPLLEASRAANPEAHLCCYGLYSTMNAGYLRSLGVQTLLGGEFEDGLVELAGRLDRTAPQTPAGDLVSLGRMRFHTPDRSGLPPLARYAALVKGGVNITTGYTEASRGCKHMCRHCPVVPIYQGSFRVVPVDVVLADIAQQVDAGARHITFGDPDFFNGPTHAVRLLQAFHAAHPRVTCDVTIKIEHLLQHHELLPVLVENGCLLVTTAVESVDDHVLALLDKGHTRQDFYDAVTLCRNAGITLTPTFIPFTPWTSLEGYRDLLRVIAGLDLVDHVAPVQLALRLLITAGSRLLELPEIASLVQPFQPATLLYRWAHPDPSMDELANQMLQLVDREQKRGSTRRDCFARIWELAHNGATPGWRRPVLPARATIPYLNEPWYC